MGDSASPLMYRRRLRNELRAARLDKGLTQEHVATEMEWSLSKMNRIEKAKTGISANDLKVLLDPAAAAQSRSLRTADRRSTEGGAKLFRRHFCQPGKRGIH